MRSIVFSNRKGGCGKSSCVYHLGIRFAQMGLRVLLVDADPQASLSQGILGRDALEIDPATTLAGLWDYPSLPFASLVRAGGREGLSLVAGHERMDHHNAPDPWETGGVQFALRGALAEVTDDYDLCLLDTPPHVGLCAWSALVAADGVVIPAMLEDFSILGIGAVMATIERVREVANPELATVGILPMMLDKRLGIHTSYADVAREAYGETVFAATVPASVDYKVSVTAHLGITEYKPRGEASRALVRVADELLARLDERQVGQGVEPAVMGVA